VRFDEGRVRAHQQGDFLFDPDVEALGRVAALRQDPKLAALARDALNARYSGASAEEIVQRWLQVRPAALVGFDAATAIRAALAVGERGLAHGLAEAVLAASPRWGEGPGDAAQLATSRGALLEALAMLDADHYHAGMRDLADHLLLTQSYDGTWATRNTQATAYAVLGLQAFGDEGALAAAAHGRKFLRATQLANGGWASFNDYTPEPFVGEVVHEVSAEALRALARR
jgi:hypothetical protein